ncbi:MAG: hypothetical protein M1825_001663 [Sarcosagium campestre]|nr:MAG: hypothetical protein M1825_001663 [Sarcosagium campestre]
MHTVQRDDGKSAEVAVSFSDYARPASVEDWPQEMATHPIAFYCARAKGDNSFPAPAGWTGDAQSSNAMIKNVVNKLTAAAIAPTIPATADEVFPTRQ